MRRSNRVSLVVGLLALASAITAGSIQAAAGRVTHIASPAGGSPSSGARTGATRACSRSTPRQAT